LDFGLKTNHLATLFLTVKYVPTYIPKLKKYVYLSGTPVGLNVSLKQEVAMAMEHIFSGKGIKSNACFYNTSSPPGVKFGPQRRR
jgi:hypothetical protein